MSETISRDRDRSQFSRKWVRNERNGSRRHKPGVTKAGTNRKGKMGQEDRWGCLF